MSTDDYVGWGLLRQGVRLSSNAYVGTGGSVVAGLLWDRIGHAAVFYYGAIFGLAGSIGLIVPIPERYHLSAA